VDLGHQPDFVKLAEAYGVTGIRIERPEEVKAGIEKAISTPGPVVVDVVVDREENCFPMIPAGAAIKDIIDVGEPIPDNLFQGWR
jgi:acetolactate synthase-1/2/3 large subunit